MDQKYILKDKKLIPATLEEWATWFETGNRVVKQTTLPDGKLVSTVFLGLDHSFGRGEPLLFETMVFPSEADMRDLDSDRYSTYEQAEKGHEEMIKKWSDLQPKEQR